MRWNNVLLCDVVKPVQSRLQLLKSTLCKVGIASVLLGAMGCGLASVLACFGGLWWLLDLLSHFRVQYSWLLLVSTAALLFASRWRSAAGSGGALALNLCFILPLYWGNTQPVDSSREQLSLVVFNVNYRNVKFADVAAYVAERDADVIVIIEATPPMKEALLSSLPAYEMIGYTLDDAFGMLLFSRLPIHDQNELYLGDSRLLALSVNVTKGSEIFSVLGIHTMPPAGATNSALRDKMMDQAKSWAEEVSNPVVVGDLNATPWSSAFRSITDGTLHNTQKGFGIQTSWPNEFWPLSIPIDHGLIGENLTTVSRSVGPFLGSDHRPLLLQVGFRK